MSIENQISEKLWNAIKDNYNNEDYASAIYRSLLFYSGVVQEKSGSQLDGAKLMQNVFSVKNHKISITDCITEDDINIQTGYKEIATGLMRMIRAPRAHSVQEDTKEDADKIIMFVDYMVTFVIDFKKPDIVDEWVDYILDKTFNTYESDADVIFKKIPAKKRLDVLVGILKKYEKIETCKNRRFVLSKLYLALNKREKEKFIDLINKILLKLEANENLKKFLFLLPKEVWKNVELFPKLHISGILLDSLEKAESKIVDGREQLNFEADLCLSSIDVFFEIVSKADYKICIEKIFTSYNYTSNYMKLAFLKEHFLFSFEKIDCSFFRKIYLDKLCSKSLDPNLKFILEKYGHLVSENGDIVSE